MLTDLLQPIANGILLGGLYASVSIGLSLVFGVMRMVNLAHGDLLVLACYGGAVIATCLGANVLLALIAIVPGMFLLGFVLQKHLFNKVVRQGMEPPLIMGLGLSIVIQNALHLIFTPDARFLFTEFAVRTIHISDSICIPVIYVLGFVSGLAIILLLHVFLKLTRLGIAIRASSDDEQTAKLMGIDTDETYAYAMAIAASTAGVAGIVIGMAFTFYPYTGSQYLITAFGVVVIGGMGSMMGTLAGGILLGLAQLVGAHLFGPGYQLLSGYLVLLFVLVLRPQGIFGRMVNK